MTEAKLNHSEAMMNILVTWPSLKCSLNAITGNTRGLTSFPSEEQLVSMTTQLKNNDTEYDERSYHKAKHQRLWSISYPSPNLFVMSREDKCGIPKSFTDDTKILLDYIRFGWTLKERIEKTLKTIEIVESAHKESMKNYRYKPLPPDKDLTNLINPSIIKVTERIHANFFVEDGPYSSPNIPFSP
ncbi:hypothetical protein BDC45DRAFT_537413 [Circinella umbellata]|nr:hypothetical protein BDC45DRAFT_537413 [Circinella umbellata]